MNNTILTIIIIIALIILMIVLLSFIFCAINNRSHKVFFDKQLPNISRDFIQTIFYPENNNQLNITNLSHKILSNQLAVSMPNLDENLFKQLPRILKFYQSQDTSNTYINQHFQYIVQSLGIKTNYNNLKTYHPKIALAATLDNMFTVLNNSEISPDIIHEIVNHFHQEVYEQAGIKILNNIFNTDKNPTNIIKPVNHIIQFAVYNYNLITISIISNMSLFDTAKPNKVHSFSSVFHFNMLLRKNPRTNRSSISYNQTTFTLFIPNSIKHYITKEKCNTQCMQPSSITQDPDCATLHYYNTSNSHTSTLEYRLPNPKAKPLFQNRRDNIQI
ncbi:hypothetical protein ECHHL_0764 [Ehrlichia chaffeensis str. Heartland]|uniref:Conserved domain protein n=1 Tax=Ehrlichia chaffeensis (strain ATCC CRL-10679 / Arkansas) TaxID=205920 RepID=Q2GFX4_EHRCR|nr:hypothetical protein [Ehrlichia chaffeensis]ABD44595.1 conserved domain protein [Ehrlichia chaffeensis str. Arkansas]AHX03909.1 hypothetical protein ECHHL_0764 [Ehrlichia chaffeensis str. Heartland]AHX05362.1 hypothetical protein ECHJAX_0285 [Ehrlichia chaffeensis str. Jax]AHX06349.1 hypothetical protein ECHLIB_0281 [Ehrlichia chaffeensis str. Liberty]AHX07615.1 hypothetical protein ECHOSC_0775 [Ehrlichia chaffeensis str. Osceola]